MQPILNRGKRLRLAGQILHDDVVVWCCSSGTAGEPLHFLSYLMIYITKKDKLVSQLESWLLMIITKVE